MGAISSQNVMLISLLLVHWKSRNFPTYFYYDFLLQEWKEHYPASPITYSK